MDSGLRAGPDAAIVAPTARRCPTVASRHGECDDLPNQPRRSQQPDVGVFSSLQRSRSECPSVPSPLKFVRPFEAARSRGERPDVANDPDANRSDVFVLRPYKLLLD